MLGDAREVDREGAGDLAGIDVVDRDARWLASAARTSARGESRARRGHVREESGGGGRGAAGVP